MPTPATLDPANSRHAHLATRLAADPMIWLGTVRPDGRPHLVAVWFLWDAGRILIFSKPDQKVRNLQHNTQVVLALDDTHGGADPAVVEGVAEILPAGTADPTLAAYTAKYGAQMTQLGMDAMQMASEYSVSIRVTPTRFR